eukprot:g4649.t1
MYFKLRRTFQVQLVYPLLSKLIKLAEKNQGKLFYLRLVKGRKDIIETSKSLIRYASKLLRRVKSLAPEISHVLHQAYHLHKMLKNSIPSSFLIQVKKLNETNRNKILKTNKQKKIEHQMLLDDATFVATSLNHVVNAIQNFDPERILEKLVTLAAPPNVKIQESYDKTIRNHQKESRFKPNFFSTIRNGDDFFKRSTERKTIEKKSLEEKKLLLHNLLNKLRDTIDKETSIKNEEMFDGEANKEISFIDRKISSLEMIGKNAEMDFRNLLWDENISGIKEAAELFQNAFHGKILPQIFKNTQEDIKQQNKVAFKQDFIAGMKEIQHFTQEFEDAVVKRVQGLLEDPNFSIENEKNIDGKVVVNNLRESFKQSRFQELKEKQHKKNLEEIQHSMKLKIDPMMKKIENALGWSHQQQTKDSSICPRPTSSSFFGPPCEEFLATQRDSKNQNISSALLASNNFPRFRATSSMMKSKQLVQMKEATKKCQDEKIKLEAKRGNCSLPAALMGEANYVQPIFARMMQQEYCLGIEPKCEWRRMNCKYLNKRYRVKTVAPGGEKDESVFIEDEFSFRSNFVSSENTKGLSDDLKEKLGVIQNLSSRFVSSVWNDLGLNGVSFQNRNNSEFPTLEQKRRYARVLKVLREKEWAFAIAEKQFHNARQRGLQDREADLFAAEKARTEQDKIITKAFKSFAKAKKQLEEKRSQLDAARFRFRAKGREEYKRVNNATQNNFSDEYFRLLEVDYDASQAVNAAEDRLIKRYTKLKIAQEKRKSLDKIGAPDSTLRAVMLETIRARDELQRARDAVALIEIPLIRKEIEITNGSMCVHRDAIIRKEQVGKVDHGVESKTCAEWWNENPSKCKDDGFIVSSSVAPDDPCPDRGCNVQSCCDELCLHWYNNVETSCNTETNKMFEDEDKKHREICKRAGESDGKCNQETCCRSAKTCSEWKLETLDTETFCNATNHEEFDESGQCEDGKCSQKSCCKCTKGFNGNAPNCMPMTCVDSVDEIGPHVLNCPKNMIVKGVAEKCSCFCDPETFCNVEGTGWEGMESKDCGKSGEECLLSDCCKCKTTEGWHDLNGEKCSSNECIAVPMNTPQSQKEDFSIVCNNGIVGGIVGECTCTCDESSLCNDREGDWIVKTDSPICEKVLDDYYDCTPEVCCECNQESVENCEKSGGKMTPETNCECLCDAEKWSSFSSVAKSLFQCENPFRPNPIESDVKCTAENAYCDELQCCATGSSCGDWFQVWAGYNDYDDDDPCSVDEMYKEDEAKVPEFDNLCMATLEASKLSGNLVEAAACWNEQCCQKSCQYIFSIMPTLQCPKTRPILLGADDMSFGEITTEEYAINKCCVAPRTCNDWKNAGGTCDSSKIEVDGTNACFESKFGCSEETCCTEIKVCGEWLGRNQCQNFHGFQHPEEYTQDFREKECTTKCTEEDCCRPTCQTFNCEESEMFTDLLRSISIPCDNKSGAEYQCTREKCCVPKCASASNRNCTDSAMIFEPTRPFYGEEDDVQKECCVLMTGCEQYVHANPDIEKECAEVRDYSFSGDESPTKEMCCLKYCKDQEDTCKTEGLGVKNEHCVDDESAGADFTHCSSCCKESDDCKEWSSLHGSQSIDEICKFKGALLETKALSCNGNCERTCCKCDTNSGFRSQQFWDMDKARCVHANCVKALDEETNNADGSVFCPDGEVTGIPDINGEGCSCVCPTSVCVDPLKNKFDVNGLTVSCGGLDQKPCNEENCCECIERLPGSHLRSKGTAKKCLYQCDGWRDFNHSESHSLMCPKEAPVAQNEVACPSGSCKSKDCCTEAKFCGFWLTSQGRKCDSKKLENLDECDNVCTEEFCCQETLFSKYDEIDCPTNTVKIELNEEFRNFKMDEINILCRELRTCGEWHNTGQNESGCETGEILEEANECYPECNAKTCCKKTCLWYHVNEHICADSSLEINKDSLVESDPSSCCNHPNTCSEWKEILEKNATKEESSSNTSAVVTKVNEPIQHDTSTFVAELDNSLPNNASAVVTKVNEPIQNDTSTVVAELENSLPNNTSAVVTKLNDNLQNDSSMVAIELDAFQKSNVSTVVTEVNISPKNVCGDASIYEEKNANHECSDEKDFQAKCCVNSSVESLRFRARRNHSTCEKFSIAWNEELQIIEDESNVILKHKMCYLKERKHIEDGEILSRERKFLLSMCCKENTCEQIWTDNNEMCGSNKIFLSKQKATAHFKDCCKEATTCEEWFSIDKNTCGANLRNDDTKECKEDSCNAEICCRRTCAWYHQKNPKNCGDSKLQEPKSNSKIINDEREIQSICCRRPQKCSEWKDAVKAGRKWLVATGKKPEDFANIPLEDGGSFIVGTENVCGSNSLVYNQIDVECKAENCKTKCCLPNCLDESLDELCQNHSLKNFYLEELQDNQRQLTIALKNLADLPANDPENCCQKKCFDFYDRVGVHSVCGKKFWMNDRYCPTTELCNKMDEENPCCAHHSNCKELAAAINKGKDEKTEKYKMCILSKHALDLIDSQEATEEFCCEANLCKNI